MKQIEKKILEYAARNELLKDDDVKRVTEVRDETGENVDQVIIRLGLATKEQIYGVLEEMTGYPTVDLSQVSLEKEVLELIPEAVARRNQAIPLFKTKDSLALAMVDPLNFEALDSLRAASGLTIEPFIAAPTDVGRALDQYYGGRQSMAELFESKLEKPGFAPQEEIRIKGFEDQKETSPVTLIVNRLLLQAIRENSSDVHIEPWGERLRVRYRIDGILHDVPAPNLEVYEAIVSRVKILGGMNIAEKRIPQDGRVDIVVDGREVGLRLSTYPTYFGEKVVIRILDKGKAVTELISLGFRGESLRRFEKLIREPHGVLLVTGPTGSGKTTTLYAVLNKLKGVDKNILTIEDPIEYQMDLICQSQVNPKAGMTFATGLRAILRQDPDVIMVGEIRDTETAEIAIHSALTGHLVLSTLHTNDSSGAVARLIDMGVEPFLIASSLVGILAQRLVRLVCQECKEVILPDDELLGRIGIPEKKGDVVFYRGQGCGACKGTGYKGRTGIYEVLIVDKEMRELIARGTSSMGVREHAVRSGMVLLREDGLSKALEGITSVEEVLRVTGSE
ncbi:MAG: GspE/PulE family protein [Candidatus Glassbacteria bacterium]